MGTGRTAGSGAAERPGGTGRPRWTQGPALLWAIVALGAVLRFYRLGAQSLWIDEILTIHAANLGEALRFPDVFWNIQGPLHATIIHGIAIFSTSEAVFRSVSALFGVALIPIVYLLGSDLADRRTGLFAALFAALSPFAIWYSQEVRNYSMLIFFSGVSTLVVWRLMERKGRGWALYIAAIVLGVLSNFATTFLAFGHKVFSLPRLLSERRLLWRWVLAYVVILVCLIPSMLGLMHWMSIDDVGERVAVVPLAEEAELVRGGTTFTPYAIPYSLYVMSYGYSLGPSSRELHTESPARAFLHHGGVVVPAMLAFVLACALGLLRMSRSRRALALTLAVVVFPMAGALVLAFLNVKPFNARYVSASFPILMVLGGAGVASLGTWLRGLLCAVIALFCVMSLGNYYFRGEYKREDVRSVASFIADNERPGDIVLAPVIGDAFEFYFDGEAEQFILYPGQTDSDEEVAGRIAARVPGRTRLWFINSRLWRTDPAHRIPAHLERSYRRTERHTFDGITLSLYDLPSVPPTEPEGSSGAGAHDPEAIRGLPAGAFRTPAAGTTSEGLAEPFQAAGLPAGPGAAVPG
jgi:mannosyltransferase